MPGLGPSLLIEFLADGQLGTQPRSPQTDGRTMVDAVRSPTRDPQLQPLAARPAVPVVTIRKDGEFRRCLRPGADALPAAPLPESASRSIESRGDQIRRRHDAHDERSESLAPESEAGGGGHAEPAELLALLSPQGGETAMAGAALEPSAPTGTIELAAVAALVERWVRRVALGGDSRRGVARLDIGSGRLAGAELTVVADSGHVSVELSLPPGQAEAGLGGRLRRRLEQRGFQTDVVVR